MDYCFVGKWCLSRFKSEIQLSWELFSETTYKLSWTWRIESELRRFAYKISKIKYPKPKTKALSTCILIKAGILKSYNTLNELYMIIRIPPLLLMLWLTRDFVNECRVNATVSADVSWNRDFMAFLRREIF